MLENVNARAMFRWKYDLIIFHFSLSLSLPSVNFSSAAKRNWSRASKKKQKRKGFVFLNFRFPRMEAK